ncbi:MAG: GAF domain-containing protein [Elusimicrobia bacterium]|nr:GAF domain-containing protein [Elusimicrobiota bacterium]
MAPELSLDTRTALELFSIAGSFNSNMDLDTLLRHIGAEAEKLLDSEASAIMLLTDDRKNLFFRVASGDKARAIRTMTLPLGQGIAGWVATNRKIEIVNDVKNDARFTGRFDKASGFETRSVLCVPMFFKGDLVGVIEVLNKRRGKYAEADAKLLESLAGLASVAITNARMISDQKNFFSHILELLVSLIETAKPGMQGHPGRAARLCCAVGRALDVGEHDYRMLYYAGLLHDVGYLAFRNIRLLGEMGLSNVSEETHPLLSVRMLEGIKILEGALPAIREHHERFDGTGFPAGLKGEAISLGGRILGLVEAVEDMRMSGESDGENIRDRAVALAKSGAGTRFDPQVAKAFAEIAANEEGVW